MLLIITLITKTTTNVISPLYLLDIIESRTKYYKIMDLDYIIVELKFIMFTLNPLDLDLHSIQTIGQPVLVFFSKCRAPDRQLLTNQSTNRQANQTSNQPTDKPINNPNKHQHINQPTSQPNTNEPTIQLFNYPTIKLFNHPTYKSTKKPTTQPTDKPTNHPTTQPSDKSTNHPTN